VFAAQVQGSAQQVVDDCLERLTRIARLRLYGVRDVVIERQCGSHVMMLALSIKMSNLDRTAVRA